MNRLIEWFANNSVTANLLMAAIIILGALTIGSIKIEVFPEASPDMVTVSVVYRGAAPEEVEEGVCVRIEEAVQDIDGIKKITSTAQENIASVMIEVKTGYNTKDVLDDVKARVDAIETFPEEIEKPVVKELTLRNQVLNVAISGATTHRVLKHVAEKVRDDLLAFPEITQVVLSDVRPYEISINVSEASLERYGLTFDEVSRAIRSASLNLPGGSVKTEGGEILLRSMGQAYHGPQFENIVLRSAPDGTRLFLKDVATVKDAFAETDQTARFDGKPAAMVQVFRVGNENVLAIADRVKSYIKTEQSRLPRGIHLTVWQDDTKTLKSRMDLLLSNGRIGFLLVFLSLALFLKLRLAGWVTAGMVVGFMGALWVMPAFDVSINLLSLFAFIIVLGIVVDDAIVIGENVYTYLENGFKPMQAAIKGTQEVALPVIFAVLTTFAAFAPLMLVTGMFGKIMRAIPVVVISTLTFSLIEALFILPSHLGHMREHKDHKAGWWARIQKKFSNGLTWFIQTKYKPSLEFALRWRYATIAAGLAVLIITFGLVGGGWIKFFFFPDVEADNVVAELTMPLGTPVERTSDAVRIIEESARKLQKQLENEGEKNIFVHIFSAIGDQPFRVRQNKHPGNFAASFNGSHLAEVNIELSSAESRNIGSTEIAKRWRKLVGPIPGAVELTFSSSIFASGEPINVEFSGNDYGALNRVTAALKKRLAQYPGVFDITDSYRSGKKEVKLDITPQAQAAGLTLLDLARQVRQAFYGDEAQRIQRGRDDIRVMVRFPESERRSLADLEKMRIRMPNGEEVPFYTAAKVRYGQGYATIERRDRRRTISVMANVDESRAVPGEIIADLTKNFLPQLLDENPAVSYSLEGQQRTQQETMRDLGKGFIVALLAIYVLLAIPFKSYIQPFIVMSAIPFGIIGAFWGHVLLGYNLTILSMFGIVALTGVVVNDSLVMVDFINRAREKGLSIAHAIRDAGVARFRPILLTSLTTFLGLTPLLLERSMQARFLIPMAISLGFGIMFATFITLILVPVIYLTQEDIKRLTGMKAETMPEHDDMFSVAQEG